jgi:hypothetical protein
MAEGARACCIKGSYDRCYRHIRDGELLGNRTPFPCPRYRDAPSPQDRFPTDARLCNCCRERLVKAACQQGLTIKQSYGHVGKRLLLDASRSIPSGRGHVLLNKLKSGGTASDPRSVLKAPTATATLTQDELWIRVAIPTSGD